MSNLTLTIVDNYRNFLLQNTMDKGENLQNGQLNVELEKQDKKDIIQQLLANGGTEISQKHRKYCKMSHEDLLIQTLKLHLVNRRLNNRINDHEPFKQKVLKGPSQDKLDKITKESPRKKFALKVCYLGWNYDGMSCQGQNDNSVEEYIFKVMNAVSLIPKVFPADPSFTRAGRTDKGVSAMGNVISLSLRAKEPEQKPIKYCSIMNALLPDDIRILGCEEVSPDFNARYWCKTRRYKYYFARGSLNIELLSKAVKQFQGTHNFINYCKINVTNTVNFERTLFSADVVKAPVDEKLGQLDERNEIYYFYYVGNSFLWHQIRYMSSMLFMIGLGKESPERLKELLSGDDTSRKPNYPMAPDYPLILEDCQYDGLSFANTDPQVVYSFYNTFNKMMQKKSIEKVMIINCMVKGRQELTLSGKITDEAFQNAMIQMAQRGQLNDCRKINKSSSRTLEETISSLKGRKKELYLKKAEKQAAYDDRVRKEKQQQQKKQEYESCGKKIKPNECIEE